ncbi:hypothetical protein I3F58_01925 [Streptomyces sp. MUM 203J]|nr:hypothetical protein [Streptomyces sp. MUM 203J]MCH0538338.1 hypothetical protein [Streptomyces sp. MUM 203J]
MRKRIAAIVSGAVAALAFTMVAVTVEQNLDATVTSASADLVVRDTGWS